MIYTWFKDCCQDCERIRVGHECVKTKDSVHTIAFCEKYPFCEAFCKDEEKNKILRPIGYLGEIMIGKNITHQSQ